MSPTFIEDALFMVLTIYAIRASSLAALCLAELFDGMGGSLESGEWHWRRHPLHEKPDREWSTQTAYLTSNLPVGIQI